MASSLLILCKTPRSLHSSTGFSVFALRNKIVPLFQQNRAYFWREYLHNAAEFCKQTGNALQRVKLNRFKIMSDAWWWVKGCGSVTEYMLCPVRVQKTSSLKPWRAIVNLHLSWLALGPALGTVGPTWKHHGGPHPHAPNETLHWIGEGWAVQS